MSHRFQTKTGGLVLLFLLTLGVGYFTGPARRPVPGPGDGFAAGASALPPTMQNSAVQKDVQDPPELSWQDRQVTMFPGFDEFIQAQRSGIALDRLNGAGMSNPPPLASLGSEVRVGGWAVTALDFVFFPGQPTTSLYFPATGQFQKAPALVPYGALAPTAEALFIPADASAVLVEFSIRSAGPPLRDCLRHNNFYLSAPKHAAAPMQNFRVERIATYAMVGYDCVTGGWAVFYSPGRSLPADLWLYVVAESGDYALWRIE